MTSTEETVARLRPSWRTEGATFARAAVSSFGASVVDGAVYSTFLAIASRLDWPASYAFAAVAGAIAGAITNFTVNRRWVYRSLRAPLFVQVGGYAVVWVLTTLALEGSLWFLVDRCEVDALIAWLPAKIVAWAGCSYPLQRLVVFGKASTSVSAELRPEEGGGTQNP